MFTLPEVPGKYPVGATTFAVHIPPPSNQECDGHVIGNAKLKTSRGGASDGPALVMREVAFTAYYPAEMVVHSGFGANLQKGMHWLSRPVKQSLKGYAYFGQISFWLVYCLLGGIARLLKIPVYPNAPLLDPKSRKEAFDNAWPLVIFSHGLGGTRTNYSHVCSRLAAEGRVVLAIEHRDGTGPFVMRRSPTPGLKEGFHQEPLLYLDPDHDVYWEQGPSDQHRLRRDQLLFRRLEVYLTYTHFRNLIESTLSTSFQPVAGRGVLHTIDGPWNFNLENRPQDNKFWKSWTRDDEGSKLKIHVDEISLVGHSFGGATVLSVVSEPVPTLERHEFVPLSVQRIIALDPWLEPLPLPGPSPRSVELSLTVPPIAPSKLLVMNSEGFTFWDDHFARLKEIVETWKKEHPGGDEDSARLLTLLRGTHVGFSDFSLLIPFGQQAKDARTFSDLIVELSSAFLNGGFGMVLQKQSVKEEEIENLTPAKDGEQGKRRYTGSFGDLVVHV